MTPQQPQPLSQPWSSCLPASLLEELRNSDDWSPPSISQHGGSFAAYTAKHFSAQPASLSSEQQPVPPALPQDPLSLAPPAPEVSDALATAADTAMATEGNLNFGPPLQPLSPTTSKAVSAAVAAVTAAVAALNPIIQKDIIGGRASVISQGGASAISGGGESAISQGGMSAVSASAISGGGASAISGGGASAISGGGASASSGSAASDLSLDPKISDAPASSAQRAATTGGSSLEPSPRPSLLHKFISVGGNAQPSQPSTFSGFVTPSLSNAASGSARASAAPLVTYEDGQANRNSGTAGGTMYTAGGAPGSGYSGYAVTPPGSALTATSADLDRLKDDILEGLREMLLDMLQPGSLPADKRTSRAISGTSADTGGGAVPVSEDPRGSVRLSREDLEEFLFNKQVRANVYPQGMGSSQGTLGSPYNKS